MEMKITRPQFRLRREDAEIVHQNGDLRKSAEGLVRRANGPQIRGEAVHASGRHRPSYRCNSFLTRSDVRPKWAYCSSSNCDIRISRSGKTARISNLPPSASKYA